MAERFDVVVIGAGAAGLFCAAVAGRRGRRVLLLDHAEGPGRKILISGGGRCNFTNRVVTAANFLGGNPHFCKAALARFSAADFIAMVEARRIAYHEKTLGQLFCDGSARDILAMLVENCAAAGVVTRLGCKIHDVTKTEVFVVATSQGEFVADALVLATGGVSIPKLGATGFAYEVARRFGLGVTQVRPGLVPLTFGTEDTAWMAALAGVSFETVARVGKTGFREDALFTHRGLSGPAVLQASSYWQAGERVVLNMLPGVDAYGVLLGGKAARPKAEVKTVLGEVLPGRLAAHLARPYAGRVIGEVANAALRGLAGVINRFETFPCGTEGFAKAEVTAGGVDTDGLSSKTMEAKAVPGLYVIGEAVDVTGWLGGYNFQWAWSSGFVAGAAA